MNGNKLVQILSTLDKSEWIAYRKYLLMHTSEDSDNYRVFAYLQKRKDKLKELPELDEIRSKHFVGLSSKSILNILSRLYLWLEECLIHQSLLQDERESQLRLVKLYNRRGLYNLADQKSRKLTKSLELDESLSIDKLWIRTQMNYYQYFSDNPIKNKVDVLGQLASNLLEAHSAQKMLVYSELLNMNRRIKTYTEVINQYDQEINLASQNATNNSLLSLHGLIKDDSAEDFYNLKRLLLDGAFERNSDFEVLICMYLFSWAFDLFTATKINETRSTIQIANYGLDNHLLNAGGQLSEVRYMNLVITISKVNSIQDTRIFIEKWAKTIKSEDVQSMKILSYALCLAIKNKCNEIPMQPTLLYFKNVHLKVSSITIYIITCFHYRSEDYAILFDTISILKRTLTRYRKQLSKKYYQGYFNFMKVTKLLVENKPFELKDYSPTTHKQWIISQIELIKKGETY